jgi:hypothetical protein
MGLLCNVRSEIMAVRNSVQPVSRSLSTQPTHATPGRCTVPQVQLKAGFSKVRFRGDAVKFFDCLVVFLKAAVALAHFESITIACACS